MTIRYEIGGVFFSLERKKKPKFRIQNLELYIMFMFLA